jgi:four helix bundle protein
MRRYQDLDVGKESIDLALIVYKQTASYPDSERYGRVSQTRRAAVSISCNIAEGQGRFQPGEFLNQLSVARGSLQELENALHSGAPITLRHGRSAGDIADKI